MRRFLAISAGFALALTGCQSLPPAAVGLVPLTAKAAYTGVFESPPGITRITPRDGLGRLDFKLGLQFAPSAAPAPFRALGLPDGNGGTAATMNLATFTEALVTLHSDSVSTGYKTGTHSITIPKAAFSTTLDAGGYYTASGTFGALRPSTDYQARIFLRNFAGSGRLGASAARTNLTIQAGPNAVDFSCVVNDLEATYRFENSRVLNRVSDGGVVKGDTIDFQTGLRNNQPGVAYVIVKLGGAAYGTGTAVLRRIPAGGIWSMFTWDTLANSTGTGEDYNAANLVAPATGVTGTAGEVTITAYNDDDEEVGRAGFPITVFGRPTTTIRVQ